MFGSQTLEIVIGLAFVYLLFSLVCSTLTEFVAQLLRLRAGTLQKAIGNMLSYDALATDDSAGNDENAANGDKAAKDKAAKDKADKLKPKFVKHFYADPLLQVAHAAKPVRQILAQDLGHRRRGGRRHPPGPGGPGVTAVCRANAARPGCLPPGPSSG